MFITLIVKWSHVCLICGISEIKIPGQSNLVEHCKQFVTALTFTQIYLSWCYDMKMSSWALQTRYTLLCNVASIRKSLFACTLPNCYMHINYVTNMKSIYIYMYRVFHISFRFKKFY